MRRAILILYAVALGGCGSAAVSDLPPPATPAGGAGRDVPAVPSDPRTARPGQALPVQGGATTATLDARARTVVLRDARTGRRRATLPAGVGPTAIAVRGSTLFIVDTQGDALLVARLGRDAQVTRRVLLAGRPAGIAVDRVRFRLWVALSARDRLVELPSHGRPHVVSSRPTVHRPQRVGVDSAGRVVVAGPGGARATYDPPRE